MAPCVWRGSLRSTIRRETLSASAGEQQSHSAAADIPRTSPFAMEATITLAFNPRQKPGNCRLRLRNRHDPYWDEILPGTTRRMFYTSGPLGDFAAGNCLFHFHEAGVFFARLSEKENDRRLHHACSPNRAPE